MLMSECIFPGRRSDTGQRNQIVGQLFGSCHVLVCQRQIRAFNADRYHSKHRKGRGTGRLLRRGRDSVAINAVGGAAYRFSANRLPTGGHQEAEAVTWLSHHAVE